jgi:hypothetical protein
MGPGGTPSKEALLFNLDPSTFILREATPAEKISCWRANSISWADKLTVEDYIGRESVNGSGELTRDGGIRYWVFTSPSPPSSNTSVGATDGKHEVIYAAAETLKKAVAVKTSDGFSIESSWAVASVFTPLQYRGNKVAAWMMRRLGEWVDSEEARCRFSVLFSDVGVSIGRSISSCVSCLMQDSHCLHATVKHLSTHWLLNTRY